MKAKSIKELINIYKASIYDKKCEKIYFKGIGHKDVYNITAPFENEGQSIIAGRVESRDSENSEVMFFKKSGECWTPVADAPVLTLQDPFVTKIDGELILGGVEIFPHPEIKGALGYKTAFYIGKNIKTIKKFSEGPSMMKDIRLIKLPEGKIGVFTRPQGKVGGRGKIGFTKIDSIDDLNAQIIEAAPLIENQFIDEEWGGVNELHVLKNGLIGALGHIACFDNEGNRHYYSMAFTFNTDTRQASDIKIIATRNELLEGEAKRPDIYDVLFSGGLIRNKGGIAELYAGVSDAEAQKVIIRDPFFD